MRIKENDEIDNKSNTIVQGNPPSLTILGWSQYKTYLSIKISAHQTMESSPLFIQLSLFLLIDFDHFSQFTRGPLLE